MRLRVPEPQRKLTWTRITYSKYQRTKIPSPWRHKKKTHQDACDFISTEPILPRMHGAPNHVIARKESPGRRHNPAQDHSDHIEPQMQHSPKAPIPRDSEITRPPRFSQRICRNFITKSSEFSQPLPSVRPHACNAAKDYIQNHVPKHDYLIILRSTDLDDVDVDELAVSRGDCLVVEVVDYTAQYQSAYESTKHRTGRASNNRWIHRPTTCCSHPTQGFHHHRQRTRQCRWLPPVGARQTGTGGCRRCSQSAQGNR